MMEKRDLKADLEQVRNFRSMWRQSTSPEEDWKIGVLLEDFCRDKAELWLEQALAEKERADKAEALARELVAALQRISEILDNATCRCRCGFCEYFNAQKRADKALAKAKEVLGDE
jgi:hypothetical protein